MKNENGRHEVILNDFNGMEWREMGEGKSHALWNDARGKRKEKIKFQIGMERRADDKNKKKSKTWQHRDGEDDERWWQ